MNLIMNNSPLDKNIGYDSESDNESDNGSDSITISNDVNKHLDSVKIKNPFFNREEIFINEKFQKIIDCEPKEIFTTFNSIYIICQKNNGTIDDSFYQQLISVKQLDKIVKNLTIIEANFKMIYNNVHKSSCVLVNKSYLKLFDSKINFNENELVIPLINLSEDHARLYQKQYEGIFTFKDYMVSKVINDFYKNNDSAVVTSFNANIINSIEESNYWTKKFTTSLNITNRFINRGFNLSLNQRIKDNNLKTILEEVNNIPREGDNYFGFLYKKKKYVDISSIIKKNGYTLYKVDNAKLDVKCDDIDFILSKTNSNYELYKLTINLLVSKDYCHLILNNKEVLSNLISGNYYDKRFDLINIFKKYILAFKYAIGYSWLAFYTEESIKKSRISDNDRFVFSINTASILPNFPILYENLHHNPYLPILISKEIIDIENNCVGIKNYKGNYGVNTLFEFKKNLNIFLTSCESKDILKGVNWRNIAFSGSLIPACVTRFNPLEKMFTDKDRYFKEYYASSDVDVMCNEQDTFKFVDTVYNFFDCIKSNILELNKVEDIVENKVIITPIKSVAIIINEHFIRNNIVKEQTKFTYDYVFTHLDDPEIIQMFYKFYIDWKLIENQKFFNDPKWTDKKYNTVFDITTLDSVVVIFARTKNDWEKYWDDIKKQKKSDIESNAEEELEEIEKEHFNCEDIDNDEISKETDANNILFRCHENLKFKISSKYINHDFELFKTRYDGSFFSTVSQFHLPCVRGFFNGKDVKLLPSCISAAMTLINIDYKYFAGSKDPIEIINKYRMRGYTTILNDSEKIRLVSYSNKVEKWDKLYGSISKSNTNSINSIFGPKGLGYTLFKPRKINKELYEMIKPVNMEYTSNDELATYKLNNETFNTGDYQKTTTAFKVMDGLTTINSFGYVKKLKKWYFDYIYENF